MHPLFGALGVLSLFAGLSEAFLFCALATILHEYGHFFVASLLGMEISTAKITPFGGMIEIPLATHPAWANLLVISAGATTNILLAILCCALWWFFPATYGATYMFAKSCVTIALVNFLPCFPLDGGRVAYIWCTEVLGLKRPHLVLGVCGVLVSAGLFVLFWFSLNLTAFLLGVFILAGAGSGLKEQALALGVSRLNFERGSCDVCERWVIVARCDAKVYKVLSRFKKACDNAVVVRFDGGREICVSQGEIYRKMIEKNGEIGGEITLFELFG